MEYEKIILDLINRVVALEDRVAKLEGVSADAESVDGEVTSGSKKYRFLSDFLREDARPCIRLSYIEIENILKFKLPDSASTHRAFWANTTSHAIALSWLSVNYVVMEVNLQEKYVIFEKKRDFEITRAGRSTATTEDNYLCTCKNRKMVELYNKLRTIMFEHFNDYVDTGATSYYAHWDVVGKRQRQFANIYVQKEKIRIETLAPQTSYDIGEYVPDTHGYTLNYRTDIYVDTDIEKVKGIILDSYNQIKRLV